MFKASIHVQSDYLEVKQPGTVIRLCPDERHDYHQLHPCHLGPVDLYDDMESQTLANAFRYAVITKNEIDETGEPLKAYWRKAYAGWKSPIAAYPYQPMSIAHSYWWDGVRLGTVAFRKRILVPLVVKTVQAHPLYQRLKELRSRGGHIILTDHESFNYKSCGLTLRDIMNSKDYTLSFACIVKLMLENGPALEECDL